MHKELSQAFVDTVAKDIGTILTNCAGRNRLPPEIYVVITRNDGESYSIFTAPYAVSYFSGGTEPGMAQANRLTDIARLHEQITLREHLKAVMDHHPEIALVIDDQTAARLNNEGLSLLVRDSINHCMLTGIRGRAIDVYIENAAINIPEFDGVATILYDE